MSGLMRKTHVSEVSDAGQLEPIEPAYYKPTASSPIGSQLRTPSGYLNHRNSAVVVRGQRRNGMRYLYSSGSVRQPISQLGTGPDLGVAVWTSEFQPDEHGPIHDAGFNDALFQAGYPGFNLGLSFKVPTLKPNTTGGPGFNMHMTTPNRTIRIGKFSRSMSASPKG